MRPMGTICLTVTALLLASSALAQVSPPKCPKHSRPSAAHASPPASATGGTGSTPATPTRNNESATSAAPTGKVNQGTGSEQPLSRNEKLTLLVAAITALVALIALIVSIWATKISSEARNIARHTYYDERRVLLRTERNEANSIGVLTFKTLDDSAQVSNMKIFFPSKLAISPIVLTPPDLTLYSTFVCPAIGEYLKQRIPAPKPNQAIVDERYPIYILIAVHAYMKGVASPTLGVYNLLVQYVHQYGREPSLQLNAAVLNNYVDAVDDLQAYIDQTFNAIEAHVD
jgi:hypothetical protein